MPPRTPRRSPLLIALACALALPAGTAQANPTQGSVMQDDDLLLYRSAKVRDKTLDQMQALGVDVVRVTVLWQYVARGTKAGIRADRPSAYPRKNWDRYDSLVFAAARRKIRVLFNVTGPGPSWAHERGGTGNLRRSWKPKPRDFHRFVRAVGTRYSGRYRDENARRRKLPRVRSWSLWNEPNQAGWLSPQFEQNATLGRPVPAAPAMYRRLYLQGRKALEDTGHGKDLILLGETAPLGKDGTAANTPMRPGAFIRELLCLDGNGAPLAGPERLARECDEDFAKFGSFKATAWAHHPYTKNVDPLKPPAHPDDITMGNSGRLGDLLDQAAAGSGGRLPSGLFIAMTEYGFETKPEDPGNGISREQQAAYINLGDYLAYKSPRIVAQAQFLLRDARSRAGYQSGLLTASGKVKQAAAAYAFPFIALRSGDGSYELWGQLRFRKNGSKTGFVQIQFRKKGEKDWANIGDPFAAEHVLGFWETTRAAQGPGEWRAAWIRKEGARPALSRAVEVSG